MNHTDTRPSEPSQIVRHTLGYPRIGAHRELKTALEAYWRGDSSQQELFATGRQIRQQNWQAQQKAGLDMVTTGDFAWYDQVLTMSATLGHLPSRHRQLSSGEDADIDLDTLFRVARGRAPTGEPATAAEMTKWFDTNYHYLVPELAPGQTFALSWPQIIDETREAVAAGYKAKPVIIGPLTYLWIGKSQETRFDKLSLLSDLLPVYKQLLQTLVDAGADWVQIDEPILTLDLPGAWHKAFEQAYHALRTVPAKLLLSTYFGALDENLNTAVNLPVAGLHIDVVRAPQQLITVLDNLPVHQVLSVGIVDGRNIWRNDLEKSRDLLRRAYDRLGARLWLAPSCSLLHCPVDLREETVLDRDLLGWLAFARQKLDELTFISSLLTAPDSDRARHWLQESRDSVLARRQSSLIHRPGVQQAVQAIVATDFQRQSPFVERILEQQAHLALPPLPTTTIGSFPQTQEIRKARRLFKLGEISAEEYEQHMLDHIADAIQRQEALGLDVLVHGEAERNDMVEYFGEQLDGYASTRNGWVQSYGSRCVKPPIIFGDVQRPAPMTVKWARYAQSLSEKPVKGMLTGPVTMLQWAFVRDDQPREKTALQIALALREEVRDLEAAGINVIQIDEPALREGLPLRRQAQSHYLDWAVNAFRLSAAGVSDTTQIHTHMCYSEFNDIMPAIAALDADVITIETARSNGDLIQAFEDFDYPAQIGPGVYDIHSPNVPDADAIKAMLRRMARKLPIQHLWVNPDCGLKTRGWPETEAALQQMVAAATQLRREMGLAAG
ncbi:MAG: 5-methyltetrahydropteroyltriglutamate--homocysteine S-methyltransferase [Pseudohongiella sp.]|nr:5-methyltetrahydropteroyltriglutamate--homocysteine S-methyltransferase [Pseudohongiella sp.]